MIVEPCRPTEIAQIIADAYQLTRRERDIVRLLSTGHSRADIARLLVVSSHTVDDHIKRVYSKLGVRSRPNSPPRSSSTSTSPASTTTYPSVAPAGSSDRNLRKRSKIV